ncbi:MAG: hypothetical protein ACWGHO_02720 [Candidatus Moraniibacteriota bacterium]
MNNQIKKNIFLVSTVFLGCFLLSGCSEQTSTQSQPLTKESISTYESTSITEYDEPEAYEESTFNGYECTDDCSGHEAGYKWAEEQGITDSSDCDGNSNSFIEGCESYADEQEEDSYDSDYDDNGYDY